MSAEEAAQIVSVSHRRPKSAVTSARTAVTLAAATAGSVALLPSAAHAAPTPSIDQLKTQVASDYQLAEAASEAVNGANAQIASLQKQIDQMQGNIAQEQAALNGLKGALGSVAAAQYRSGGMDPTLELMLAASPDSYLQQASVLNQISGDQAQTLKSIQQGERQIQQNRQTAAIELATLQHTRDELAKDQTAKQAKYDAAQQLLNSLTATERAAVQRALYSGGSTSSPVNLPPVSGRAGAAVRFAESQVGKAYVYGATGPSAYDCSSLVQAAWAAAGVSIPRTSEDQYASLTSIPVSDLQPGDIVFYYSGPSHVGIYVGNGEIVNAENPSTGVVYAGLNSMPVTGAARV